ncbi:MAG: HlyC/CorC family transporter [Acidobacteria bacterium]|nr:HlyC/CorC family transporter [Acidobacteriota bacterium]
MSDGSSLTLVWWSGVVFFLMALTYLSSVEASISNLSQVARKVLAEREGGNDEILNAISEDKFRILIPLHLGIQISSITLAILTTTLVVQASVPQPVLVAFLIMTAVVLLFRQLIPRLLVRRNPEKKLVLLLPIFRKIYRLLHSIALPISGTLNFLKRREPLEEVEARGEEETRDEEIQAFLDVGQEEGILEAEDSPLIQSVVEFGDKLVKDVMTSRSAMVAIDETATVDELRRIMVSSRHSRVPVYRGQMDHVVGITYVRHLLAYLERGSPADPIAPLVRPAHCVPETKRISELLKELQKSAYHMAIVVDEFGGVAGLVTMEDLLEEIVGEIRDEDEIPAPDIVDEGDGRYAVRGGVGVERLEKLFDLSLGDTDYSTVAGLIVTYLGRLPRVGERFECRGLQVEVVDADTRKIHMVRLSKSVSSPSSGPACPAPGKRD